MKAALRSAIVFLVLAVSLPAQKLSLFPSVDGGAQPAETQALASDSTGIYSVTLSGSHFVLRKVDPSGEELWQSQSGEARWVRASVTSSGGGVYVAGLVDGAAPGQNSAGGFDVYVARYDGAGNQLWMRQFGSTADEEAGGISADDSGVYVTSATWVFAQQSYRASLLKYSPDGSLLWTRDVSNVAFWWTPLATDGESVFLGAATGRDAFLRKYSRDGVEQWTRRFVAPTVAISALAADRSGVYAVLESSAASGANSSLRKYDANANELWITSLGASMGSGLRLRAMTVNAAGLYISDSASTALPGQCYAGNGDVVMRKYDIVSGGEIWIREFGTYRADTVTGLAANDAAVFVLAGPNLAKLESDPVADSAPRIRNECVLNAASNIGGGVTPGEIVTVLVTGAISRLLFNGIEAPILAASDDRITAVVPFELGGQVAVNVQVESQQTASEAITLPLLSDRLGVFSADRSGAGQAAIVNEDGSLNSSSHPAQPGSAVSIYSTGSSTNTVSVAISNEIIAFPEVDGGQEDYRYYAPILYSGSAAGLLQINVKVPVGVPTGSAVPLHVFVGGVSVEQWLTIAIAR